MRSPRWLQNYRSIKMQFYRYWRIRQSRIAFDTRTLFAFAIFVGVMRGVLEFLFFGVQANGSDILAYIPFYASLPFVYAAFLCTIPGIRYASVLQPVTFATLLGLLPPIIDFVARSADTHRVFYGYFVIHDLREFPWFGYQPSQNYPLGEAVTVWLTVILVTVYALGRTRNPLFALSAAILGYGAFLFYSLLIPFFVSSALFGNIPDRQTLDNIGGPALRQMLYLISASQIAIAWLVDAIASGVLKTYARRVLHFMPFLLLTCLGALQSGADALATVLACTVTLTSGIAVIAHNDFRNITQRRVGNTVGVANLFAMIFYAMILFAGYRFALLGIACFALSALYHYEFFNARSTLLGSMKIEGMWGLLTYLTGVIAGHITHPNSRVLVTSFLVFGGFSIFSVVKDAKDIRADFREKRKTLYTWARRSGFSIHKLQYILAITTGVGAIIVSLMMAGSVVTCTIGVALAGLISYSALHSHVRLWFQIFLLAVMLLIVNAAGFEILSRNLTR